MFGGLCWATWWWTSPRWIVVLKYSLWRPSRSFRNGLSMDYCHRQSFANLQSFRFKCKSRRTSSAIFYAAMIQLRCVCLWWGILRMRCHLRKTKHGIYCRSICGAWCSEFAWSGLFVLLAVRKIIINTTSIYESRTIGILVLTTSWLKSRLTGRKSPNDVSRQRPPGTISLLWRAP